jgi:tetratricopeptide (TPR) repeat protein
VALVLTGPLLAADAEAKTPKDVAAFGTLRAPDAGVARSQAEAWLKGVGKADDKVMAEFAKVWDGDRPVLDKVADTLALGNADAAKALADARDASGDAPTAIPAFLKAGKKADYLRDNLALAYAKALSNRKVFEEALEALKTVKAENVVDPASYYFHRAVAEHALLLKKDADDSITHLLDDVVDAPERYRMVAALMAFDMLTWRDKDLGWIARKMGNVERRLELHRGGKQTQKIQKEVVARLDEIIKELENKNKGGGS